MAITERTQRLKDRCWWKHTMGGEYSQEGVQAGIERVRYYTRGYQENDQEPEPIRRARALEKVLDNIGVFIKEDELLVGGNEAKPNLLPWHPEGTCFPGLELISEMKYMPIEHIKEASEIVAYWQPRGLQSKGEAVGVPEEFEREYLDFVSYFVL